MEGVHSGQTAAREQDLSHLLAVAACETLADLHVKKIVLQILTVDEAQVLGDRGFVAAPVELLQSLLNLRPASGSFVLSDQGVTPCEILLLAFVQVYGEALVILSHLLAKVA